MPQDYRAQLTRVRFRRAVALMVMTLVLPGSAQLVAGRKEVGRIAIRIWLALLGSLVLVVLLGLTFHSFIFWFGTNTVILGLIRFVLMGMAVGWAYLFVDSWMLGDPLALQRQQRLAMVGLNGVLCFTVAGSLLFFSHVVTVEKNLITSVFGNGSVTQVHDGRYNVLLLGGDSGADRWGLRPDSMTVASIDADTGRTVLFGLPRNMLNFPFAPGSRMAKQFPHGYTCNTRCINDPQQLGLHELNSLATWAADHKSVFKGVANPGVEATKEAVEGITGLKINYYAMVNLLGFRKLVEAVGGVKLHVRDRIPIGGIGGPVTGYIQPGYRKLNGYQTLWFARSRESADDYSRMARQKCVMNAMLHQVSPQRVVLKFQSIADAGETLLTTDLPASELDTFIQLALKARSQPVRTVSFVPPMVNTGHPDIATIQAAVKKAIAPAKASGHAAAKKHRKHHVSGVTTGGSYGSLSSGYAANQASNLSDAC
ncbi:LCP family protein [Nocardioides terrisoli]|uniref:LCP family protein n=1 Tax=Nocardioides terrisoli TaxID=3388267 RepID=UPI00287B8B9F|nr:LCP family protein [Nocardioides marmorisolisilvae]